MPRLKTAALLSALAALLAAPAAHAGDLLVTDELSSSVLRYDGATGSFVGTFASGGGLTTPDALAFGPDGNLYVDNGDSVLRYNGTTGAFIDTFVAAGVGGPVDSKTLTFGPDGSLYVGSGDTISGPPVVNSARVLHYNGTTGAFLGVFATGSQLQEPMSLAFGPDGNLYVGNGVTDPTLGAVDNVLRYDGASGTFLGTFVPAQAGFIDPNGLAFGADGNLYVSNEGANNLIVGGLPQPSGTVLRFDGGTGAFKDTFVSAGSGGITEPFGLAFGTGGSLFVASGDTAEVYKYDGKTGSYQSTFVTAKSGGLDDPKGIAFFPRAAAVPEPSAFALLGLGLLPVGLTARRRHRRA